jgi:hypothetical protein
MIIKASVRSTLSQSPLLTALVFALLALSASAFFFAPRLWVMVHYNPGTFEWDRAYTYLKQVEDPFRAEKCDALEGITRAYCAFNPAPRQNTTCHTLVGANRRHYLRGPHPSGPLRRLAFCLWRHPTICDDLRGYRTYYLVRYE